MDTNIANIENRLKGQLRAYQPKPEFVNNLKKRLTTQPAIEIEKRRSNIQIFILVGGIIFVFALFFWLLSQFGVKDK